MALFYERVDFKGGDTVSSVLFRFGIDGSQWAPILALPQNGHLPAGTGLLGRFPQVPYICVPIENMMMLVNSRVTRDTVNGLRPSRLGLSAEEKAKFAASCAYGVDVSVERDGDPCVAFRWVQTIKKLNGQPFNGIAPPIEFVDVRTTGFPFYNDFNDPDSPDDVKFDDTPCGPAPKRAGQGIDFDATVSLVVWNPPKVTIVTGYSYRFQITPAGAVWVQAPHDATSAEFDRQLRILQAGVGQLRQDSGKGLDYRKPPALGSVNP